MIKYKEPPIFMESRKMKKDPNKITDVLILILTYLLLIYVWVSIYVVPAHWIADILNLGSIGCNVVIFIGMAVGYSDIVERKYYIDKLFNMIKSIIKRE